MATVTKRGAVHADPRRWWALGALVASMLTLGFDLTILNVALPTMTAQLEASTGELQWIVDSYVVVFAALMLPAGLLGDRFGRRRMLVVTLRQVGGAVGIALLGSLVADAYAGRLGTTGLPAPAAEAARESLSGAHAVAERLGLPALARSADAAYVDGMSLVLVVCGIAALVTALLVAAFLPNARTAAVRGTVAGGMAAAEADGRE
jgi:MFS family permease